MQANHLINTGAWKHQHMVALNLHQGGMCSRSVCTSAHQFSLQPLLDMYAAAVAALFFIIQETNQQNGDAEKLRKRLEKSPNNKSRSATSDNKFKMNSDCVCFNLTHYDGCSSHKDSHQTSCLCRLYWASYVQHITTKKAPALIDQRTFNRLLFGSF